MCVARVWEDGYLNPLRKSSGELDTAGALIAVRANEIDVISPACRSSSHDTMRNCAGGLVANSIQIMRHDLIRVQ